MSTAVALEEIVFWLSGCKIGLGHLFCYVNQREKQIKECNTVRHEEPNSAAANMLKHCSSEKRLHIRV